MEGIFLVKVLTKVLIIPALLLTSLIFPFNSVNAETSDFIQSKEQINNIAKKVDPNIEIVSTNELDADTPRVELNSEEELEAYLALLSAYSSPEEGTLIEDDQLRINPMAYGSFTRKSILFDGLSTFRYITFNYTKKSGKITKVSKIKGEYIGITIFKFRQDRASYTLSKNKKTINFTIRGMATCVVAYKGVEIGAKYPQTWKYSYAP